MVKRLGLLSVILALGAASLVAANVAGKWNVTIQTPDGTMAGKAEFKQAGHKVTGWVGPSETDPIPITGTVEKNKLTLKTHPQPGRTVAFEECVVTVGHEKMEGKIDSDKGTIDFVRSR